MFWQEVFVSLTSLCDASCVSPARFFSITKYFIEKDNRQLQVHWNEFQQVPWIPKAPIPYTTWKDGDNNTYSNLVLSELERSSRGETWEWISAIRLSLHYFRVGNTTRMNEFLQIFAASRAPELGEHGGALLHLAVEVDAVNIIPILLERRVNIGARDKHGRTPLHTAKSTAVAQILVDFGADVRARRHGTNDGYTPLHVAASGEIAELLLRYGAEVDAKAYDSWTPLHTIDSANVVLVLTRYGANPLERDRDGCTPLHRAFRDDVAKSLMDLCPEALNIVDNLGRPPLHHQIDSWGAETVKHAITYGADVTATGMNGETPHFGLGSFTIFNVSGYRVLIEAVVDTASIIPSKEKLSNTSTPLHKITEPELMDLFLRNGFSKFVDHKNYVHGYTPLHCVVDRDTALFHAFIRCNEWNRPLRERHWRPGLPPPFMAASFIKYSFLVPSLQLMDILLKHGADPNIPDSQGNSPLHLLAQNALGHDGHSEIVTLIEHLVNAGGDANARNMHGETPLHCASRVETVIALLNAGTDPRLVDNESVTPLHHLYRFPESCYTVVRVLLEHGADVNATDDEGFTPLHYACRLYESQSTRGLSQMRRWRSMSFSGFGQPTLQSKLKLALEMTFETVTALLDHGANVNARTRAGETALDMLSRQPYARDAYKLLISHGATHTSERLAPWWDFANTAI